MRNVMDWVFFVFYIVGNGLTIVFIVLLFLTALHQAYKKTRMKFEKKEHESVIADNSQGS